MGTHNSGQILHHGSHRYFSRGWQTFKELEALFWASLRRSVQVFWNTCREAVIHGPYYSLFRTRLHGSTGVSRRDERTLSHPSEEGYIETVTPKTEAEWKTWLLGALWLITVTLVSWGYQDFGRRLESLEVNGSPIMRERVAAFDRDLVYIKSSMLRVEVQNDKLMSELQNLREDLINHDAKTAKR